MKKWYQVTFSAKMDDDDIQAMNGCFYQAMDEAMEIKECANLKIEEEKSNGPIYSLRGPQFYKMEMVFSLDLLDPFIEKDSVQLKISQTVPFIPTLENLKLYEGTLKGQSIGENMEIAAAHFLHYNYLYPVDCPAEAQQDKQSNVSGQSGG